MRALASRLLQNASGAVAVEFALIGPLLIAMMLGVFQVGMGMQNYNALRAISADMARYAVVSYQSGNEIDNDAIRFHGRSIATRSPYSLESRRFLVVFSPETAPRLDGTTEKRFTLRYDVPSFLSILDIGDIPVSFTRTVVLQD